MLLALDALTPNYDTMDFRNDVTANVRTIREVPLRGSAPQPAPPGGAALTLVDVDVDGAGRTTRETTAGTA